jgi:hypothetical protein
MFYCNQSHKIGKRQAGSHDAASPKDAQQEIILPAIILRLSEIKGTRIIYQKQSKDNIMN